LICYSLTYYPQIRAKTGLSPQTPKKWDFTMGPDYLSGRLQLRATGRHLPYGITQCCLPPDTSEPTPPNLSHADWYSISLPRRDRRLSWPSWLDSAPAGSRTSDLSITSLMLNRCTIKTA